MGHFDSDSGDGDEDDSVVVVASVVAAAAEDESRIFTLCAVSPASGCLDNPLPIVMVAIFAVGFLACVMLL